MRLRISAVRAVGGAAILAAALAGCAQPPNARSHGKEYFPVARYGPASPRVVDDGQPVPRGGGQYLVGRPYTIAGRTYYPTENTHYSAVGYASWYGDAFHGRRTANGEVYDMRSLSAAHPTMPLPSYARVTNLANGYSMVVRINDRGPYSGGRIIDVSSRVADMLAIKATGTAKVKVDYIGAAPLEGADDTMLAASLRTDGGPANLNAGATMVADAEPPEPSQPVATPQPQAFAARPTAVERPRDAGPPFVAAANPRLLKAPAPPPRPFDLGEIARVLHAASNAPQSPRRRPQLASSGERALYFADPPASALQRRDDPFARLIGAGRR